MDLDVEWADCFGLEVAVGGGHDGWKRGIGGCSYLAGNHVGGMGDVIGLRS